MLDVAVIVVEIITHEQELKRTCITLVIAVKTFSRMALGCAFCGPLAWIFRPMAHGLATNLQLKDQYTIVSSHTYFGHPNYTTEGGIKVQTPLYITHSRTIQ